MAELHYHLLIIVEGEAPQHKAFDTKEFLADFLRTSFQPDPDLRTQLFIFCGQQLFITKGPLRYLVEGEDMLSLFNETKQLDIAHDGDWFDDDTVKLAEDKISYDAGENEEVDSLEDDPDV